VLNVEKNLKFDELDKAHKVKYLKENYSNVNPFNYSMSPPKINSEYIFMVNAFIENYDGIQNVQNEYDSQLRFANDAKEIAEWFYYADKSLKMEAQSIIDDYISKIQKI
ncbi:MAG: hypothetical protein K2J35_04520, partial [Eubacterium sp.]|nr:hypothetical protein [Eubacterium sp.]